MSNLEVEIAAKNFDGYKPAFKGAMQAYGILAIKSARWLQHVTGTGGESVEHYWKNDCETCKEIAEFISSWIDAAEQSVQADGALPSGLEERWEVGDDGKINLTKFTPRR